MFSDEQDAPPEITNLDPERQRQAKEYARIQRRFTFMDLALGTAFLLAWLLTGWSIQLRDWIRGWTSNPWLAVLVFGAIFGGAFTLLDLPLSYYTGYILPHRFKQSNQDLKGWLVDLGKGLLVSIVLGGLILEVIYYLLRSVQEAWWLWTAGFLLLFNVLLANLAPVLLFPIFYKFTPLAEEDRDLEQRLMGLAKKAGAPVMGVFRFDMSRRTKSANAPGYGCRDRNYPGRSLPHLAGAELGRHSFWLPIHRGSGCPAPLRYLPGHLQSADFPAQ